jgi:zinc protease
VPHFALRPVILALLLSMIGLPVAAAPSAPSVGFALTPPSAPVSVTLPDGMQIVCRRDSTPLVAVDAFIKVGVAQETDATAGISSLVAATLLASTQNALPDVMQQEVGALGGNVSTAWQPEWTQVSVLTVRDQFATAADLLTRVLKRATFDDTAVAAARAQALEAIDQRDADLYQTDYQGLRSSLYANTGWGLPSGGTLAVVQKLTSADLLRFYLHNYLPSNYLIVVVGDIDPQQAIHTLTLDMSDFPNDRTGRPSSSPPATPPMPAQAPSPVHLFQPDLAETAVMVGYRVAPAASSDYPALLVTNALLGGMKTSRLFTNLREKQGLAYELGSSLNAQIYTGDLTAYVFAPPLRPDPVTKKPVPTVGLITSQIQDQFESFKTTPPTAAELARAQHFLIGTYLLKHERIEDRATNLGVSVLTRGTPDFDTHYAQYINAVTLADVTRIANTYFQFPAIATIEPDAAAMNDLLSGQ